MLICELEDRQLRSLCSYYFRYLNSDIADGSMVYDRGCITSSTTLPHCITASSALAHIFSFSM